MILFYNGFSDRIPSQSGLVWLLTKAGRVEELASATASQRWSSIVVTIKLQNPEKHCKSAQKPYTRTSKTINSGLFFLSSPCLGHKSAYRGVPVLVIGNDQPPIVDFGVGQSRRHPTHTSPRVSDRGFADPINRRSHCPLVDRHVSPPIAISSNSLIRSYRRSTIGGSMAQSLNPSICNLQLQFGLKGLRLLVKGNSPFS